MKKLEDLIWNGIENVETKEERNETQGTMQVNCLMICCVVIRNPPTPKSFLGCK